MTPRPASTTAGTVTLKCRECGDSKIVFKSEVFGKSARYRDGGSDYQCRTCWNKQRKGKRFNPRVRSTVTLTCSVCGKQKEYPEYDTKRILSPYMCKSCRITHNNKTIPRKRNFVRVEVVCSVCGKVNLDLPHRAKAKKTDKCYECFHAQRRIPYLTEIACPTCGKKRNIRTKNLSRCNPECHSCRYTGHRNHAWRGGSSYQKYPEQWTPALRRDIRDRDDHRCQLCNTAQTSSRMPIHHIDYNKNNLDPTNLITLCRACHTRTNYGRNRWPKIFREVLIYRGLL